MELQPPQLAFRVTITMKSAAAAVVTSTHPKRADRKVEWMSRLGVLIDAWRGIFRIIVDSGGGATIVGFDEFLGGPMRPNCCANSSSARA